MFSQALRNIIQFHVQPKTYIKTFRSANSRISRLHLLDSSKKMKLVRLSPKFPNTLNILDQIQIYLKSYIEMGKSFRKIKPECRCLQMSKIEKSALFRLILLQLTILKIKCRMGKKSIKNCMLMLNVGINHHSGNLLNQRLKNKSKIHRFQPENPMNLAKNLKTQI